MTLMHLGLIRVRLVAKTVLITRTVSKRVYCCDIVLADRKRELCQHCQTNDEFCRRWGY